MMKRPICFGIHPFIRDHAPVFIYEIAICKPSAYRDRTIFAIPLSAGKEPGTRFLGLYRMDTFLTQHKRKDEKKQYDILYYRIVSSVIFKMMHIRSEPPVLK